MTASHLLVIEHDGWLPGPVHIDQHIYPEHLEQRRHRIVCVDPPTCNGWQECTHRHHICPHGHPIMYDELSIEGPCPGHDDRNCIDDDEAQFHGQWHTHRWGWGWTIEWPGCVVADADWEEPYGTSRLPRGVYEINDDWDDTSVYLEFTTDPPTEVHDVL